ncbi:glyco X protein [Rutstroemia sp. NJR-2017a BBW]|nr:glyco X protein [Rutstroemia sp. NJR-2017a BBW]
MLLDLQYERSHFRFRKCGRANSAIDTAYLDAQKIGREPELCAADSSFNTDYSNCQACVFINSENATVAQSYLTPKFGIFLDYCSSLPTSGSASSAISATSTAGISISSLPNITTGASFSTPLTTHGSAYSTITTLHTQSIPLFNGSIVTYTFTDVMTLEDQPTSSSTLSNVHAKSSSSHKVALIAGILAPIGSLILLGFCFWILRRYSRSHKFGIWRRTATSPDEDTGQEKAQLHSDCLPLALKSPQEMEGLSKSSIAELQAVEPVVELPGVLSAVNEDK